MQLGVISSTQIVDKLPKKAYLLVLKFYKLIHFDALITNMTMEIGDKFKVKMKKK